MYKNYFFVGILMLLWSACASNTTDIYTAHKTFGEIDNHIAENVLDSIRKSVEFPLLSDYSTSNVQKQQALEILTTELSAKKLMPSEFFVFNVTQTKATVSFELRHIDGYVYAYNYEQQKLQAPQDAGFPAKLQGNVSGLDGVYVVDTDVNRVQSRLLP